MLIDKWTNAGPCPRPTTKDERSEFFFVHVPPVSVTVAVHSLVELIQRRIRNIITSIATGLVDGIDKVVEGLEIFRQIFAAWNDQNLCLAQRRSLMLH